MTIRCGLGGIYTCLDEFKNNNWQVGVLDDSSVIAYSKEQVTKESVEEWLNNLKKKYSRIISIWIYHKLPNNLKSFN